MKKIGILGGTFNPVHIEHKRLALSAIDELKLDKLIVMPTFISPHKSLVPAPSVDRINMLKIAFADCSKVEVSDYEIIKQGTSYTYLTVEHFKGLEPCQLYFICGGDMLENFKFWKFPERVLDSCTLACFEREDFFVDFDAERRYFQEKFNKDFIKLSYKGKSLSSTKIRIYSAFNLPLENLCEKAVEEYIKKNNLYGGDKFTDFIKTNLPLKRIKHTANVVITALEKAKQLNLDSQKVFISACLHDCAKYIDYKTVEGFTIGKDVPQPVIHAFLGAFIAEKYLGVTDQEILDAIRFHTSGKANMSLLGKLIFVADMVEEGRDYQGVEQLRELFYNGDFEFCFRECLREEVIHLMNKKQRIYIQTLNAFDYYNKN